MPYLRTDDGPRKLRAVWLGPAGHTLAFQWTYVQWLVTLLTVPVTAALGAAVLQLLGADKVWTAGIGVLWGGAAGLWIAVRLMRNVTFDEPLRYQRRLLRREFDRRASTVVEDRPLLVALAAPSVGYLSGPALQALGWDGSEQRPLPVPDLDPVAVPVPVTTDDWSWSWDAPVPAPRDEPVEAPYLSRRDPAPASTANEDPRLRELVSVTSSAASRKAPDGPQDDR